MKRAEKTMTKNAKRGPEGPMTTACYSESPNLSTANNKKLPTTDGRITRGAQTAGKQNQITRVDDMVAPCHVPNFPVGSVSPRFTRTDTTGGGKEGTRHGWGKKLAVKETED